MVDVRPVSQYPPAGSRSLEQWLDPALGAQYPADVPTRLREIADLRARHAGMWTTVTGFGGTMVLIAALSSALIAQPASSLPWLIVGAVLCAAGLLGLVLMRHWLPGRQRVFAQRGPTTVLGGVLLAAFLQVPVLLILFDVAQHGGPVLVAVLAETGFLVGALCMVILPLIMLGRSRRALRRRAQRDVLLRAALERERTTWGGDRRIPMFGPL